VSDGVGFTVTVTQAVSLQPNAFVPITEYVVVAVGLTTSVLPDPRLVPDGGHVANHPVMLTPGLSVATLNVLELPKQIDDGDALAVISGFS
jgi:hypothetical protein